MFNPNGPELFNLMVRLIVLLTALPIHECAHGWVANKLGDPTARNMGRLTLNPIKHLDPMGSLMILLAGVGWARPVPVNTRNFKHIKRDMAITALAGPISNILLALLLLAGYKGFVLTLGLWAGLGLSQAAFTAVYSILFTMVNINVGLAVFNLLPIPPLDGSRLLTALLPLRIYYGIAKYERVFMGLLILGLVTGVLSIPMGWATDGVLTALDFLTGFLGGRILA